TLPSDALRRRIANAPSGKVWTVANLRAAVGRDLVAFAEHRAPVTDELERMGFPVVLGRPDSSLAALVRAIVGPEVEVAAVADRWCMPLLVDDGAPGWSPLRESLVGLLRTAGAKLADIVLGDCDYPGSPIADRVAITQEEPGALTDLAALDTLR